MVENEKMIRTRSPPCASRLSGSLVVSRGWLRKCSFFPTAVGATRAGAETCVTEAAEDKKRSWSLRVRMVRGCYRSVPREATPLPVQSCAHQNSETAEGTERNRPCHTSWKRPAQKFTHGCKCQVTAWWFLGAGSDSIQEALGTHRFGLLALWQQLVGD